MSSLAYKDSMGWTRSRLNQTFYVLSETPPDVLALIGKPQFQAGQIVTVLNPWWWVSRDGQQIKDRVRCRIEKPIVYWHANRDDGGHWSVDVRETDHPGAHGRSIHECDIEGFVAPDYPTHPTGLRATVKT